MPRAYLLQLFQNLKTGIKFKRAGEQEYLASLIDTLNKRVDSRLPLSEEIYVAFDLETTGLHPFGGDQIIALGAVRTEDGRVIRNVFERVVNPRRPIPPEIQELTGITEAAVVAAPGLQDVLPAFVKFLCQGVLIGYNADFDLAFLNLAIRFCCGAKINRAVVLDVMTVVRALNPRWEYFGLDEIAAYYEVPLEARHTAVGDAIIHARLFLRLIPLLEERGIYTLNDLRRYLQYRALC